MWEGEPIKVLFPDILLDEDGHRILDEAGGTIRSNVTPEQPRDYLADETGTNIADEDGNPIIKE